MLANDIPELVNYIKNHANRLENSKELIDIYENDLLKYVERMLKHEMGEQTFAQIVTRIPPINMVKKIVDKLSTIYQSGVMRKVVDGTDSDQELLDYYIDQFDMNSKMNQGNEFFNLDRYNLMMPFLDDENQKPALRAVPNDKFLVYSDNQINPMTATHVLMMLKKSKSINYKKADVQCWMVWTKEEITIFDEEGNQRSDLYFEGMDGTNPYGVLPFTYYNSSQNFLVPPADSDTKRMAVLMPAQFADLNYAAKFQSFSSIFAFNIDQETWTLAPNAIHFIDDKPGKGTAKVEVVKPTVDITEVTQLIVTQLSMYLNSRGIKPGSIGDITTQNLASGISKIIDEADTSELKTMQSAVYARGEVSFWNKVLRHMHPTWINQINAPKNLLSPNARIEVTFPPQKPMVDRGTLVTTAVNEMNNGLKSRKTVMEELNPDWSLDRIDEEIKLMDSFGEEYLG